MKHLDRKSLGLLASGSALIVASIYGSVTTSHADAPVAPVSATTSTDRPALPWWMKRACPTEDSWNCYWSATGDSGRSFFVRRLPGTDRLCYLYAAGSDPQTDQCIRRARGL